MSSLGKNKFIPELKTLLSYIPTDKYGWKEALLKVDDISFFSAMAQLFHKKLLNIEEAMGKPQVLYSRGSFTSTSQIE